VTIPANVTPIQPYHRCPKCPKCRPEAYNYVPDAPKVNLVCAACGDGWLGTADELAQAARADAAYAKARKEGRL
jgi:hypothetical protein